MGKYRLKHVEAFKWDGDFAAACEWAASVGIGSARLHDCAEHGCLEVHGRLGYVTVPRGDYLSVNADGDPIHRAAAWFEERYEEA